MIRTVRKTFCFKHLGILLTILFLVSSAEAVPTPTPNSDFLAKPGEVSLEGSLRSQELISPVGHIRLRWPRKVEALFGRTPERAMVDASTAVSHALKKYGFPPDIQNLNLRWEVVFMDEELPESQIPTYLVNNCHPAWMTPLANLYVVSQRVVAGCMGKEAVPHTRADYELSHILIHEMGHAVEFQLTGGKFSEDRMRAEGFATWFEQFASDYSSVIGSGEMKARYKTIAGISLRARKGAFTFAGSAEDYAISSMFFNAIVQKRGVAGLMDVYRMMQSDGLPFLDSVAKKFNWDAKDLGVEVQKYVEG